MNYEEACVDFTEVARKHLKSGSSCEKIVRSLRNLLPAEPSKNFTDVRRGCKHFRTNRDVFCCVHPQSITAFCVMSTCPGPDSHR